MLQPVHRFLSLKCGYFIQQIRVRDLVPVNTNAVDKELFAKREQHGHRIEVRGFESAATVPIVSKRFSQLEKWPARAERQGIGALTLHGRHRGFMAFQGQYTVTLCSRRPVHVVENTSMSEQIWPVLLIIAAIIVYVLAKVIFYARKSERQWQDVDKSKLKTWDDDDES